MTDSTPATPLTPDELLQARGEILATLDPDGNPFPPEIQFQHYARAGQIWGERLFATIDSLLSKNQDLVTQLARVNYLWGQEAIALNTEISRLKAIIRVITPVPPI